MGEKLLSDREVGASHPESRSWPQSPNRPWSRPRDPCARNQPRRQETPAHAAEESIEFDEDPVCPEPTAPQQPRAAYMATASASPPMTEGVEDVVYICAAQHFPGAYTATAAVADPPTTATPTATARANQPKTTAPSSAGTSLGASSDEGATSSTSTPSTSPQEELQQQLCSAHARVRELEAELASWRSRCLVQEGTISTLRMTSESLERIVSRVAMDWRSRTPTRSSPPEHDDIPSHSGPQTSLTRSHQAVAHPGNSLRGLVLENPPAITPRRECNHRDDWRVLAEMTAETRGTVVGGTTFEMSTVAITEIDTMKIETTEMKRTAHCTYLIGLIGIDRCIRVMIIVPQDIPIL